MKWLWLGIFHDCTTVHLFRCFCTILVEGSSILHATGAGDLRGWYHPISECQWSWRHPTASGDESPCSERSNSPRQGVYKVFTHIARLNNPSLAWYSRNQLWSNDQNSFEIQGLSLQGLGRSRKAHLGGQLQIFFSFFFSPPLLHVSSYYKWGRNVAEGKSGKGSDLHHDRFLGIFYKMWS